jgi:hypothetical protein
VSLRVAPAPDPAAAILRIGCLETGVTLLYQAAGVEFPGLEQAAANRFVFDLLPVYPVFAN